MDASIMDVKFTYPLEDLDRIIQQMDQGIKPFGMNERLKVEIELRRKQLKYLISDYIDEDEEEGDISLAELHERMTAEIEKERRKATHEKATFRPLPADVYAQLCEDMQTSVVRMTPGDDYHKPDDVLYADKEQREIMRKLSSIRQAYHDPISWANAMKVVIKGIQYSLQHDYPLGAEWAIKEFNAGRLKYTFGPIPKLFVGFGTKQITDTNILKGILSGEVKVISRDTEKEKLKSVKRKRGKPINVDYSIISQTEYEQSVALHNRGIDTPIGIMLKSKAGLFDRLSMPFQIAGYKSRQQQQREEQLMQFDWMREGAGREYYEKINDVQVDHVAQFMQDVQTANNGEITQSMMTDARQFLTGMSHPEIQTVNGMPYQDSYKPFQPSERAQEIEKSIMDQIRRSNVGLL